MDNTESDLTKIFKTTLIMCVVGFYAALWFKMENMMVEFKYMEERLKWLEGSVPACEKERIIHE